MAASWSSVAVSEVTRVRESVVWWKRWKGGGGVVGRAGYLIGGSTIAPGRGAVGSLLCEELQPDSMISANMDTSAKGAAI